MIPLLAILYTGTFAPTDFATKVFDWNGVNGVSGHANPLEVIGYPAPLSTPTVPDNSSVFSFGWGGWITVGFDRPILNRPGPDVIVFGNAFYLSGDATYSWREPGYVEVGVDADHNGVPSAGDKWYLILGAPEPPYPLPASYWGAGSDPILGYADCTPTDNQGNPRLPDDPLTPGISTGSAGGDAIDLAWAVDEGTLQPVSITEAHFLRITHALNTGSFLGPSSTEVDAVALIHRPGPMQAPAPREHAAW